MNELKQFSNEIEVRQGSVVTNEMRVAAIWSRDYTVGRSAGRISVCRHRRRLLDQRYKTLHIVVPAVLCRPTTLERRVAFAKLLTLVLKHRARSVQSLLFKNDDQIAQVLSSICDFQPDVVLIDSTRLLDVAAAIREALPSVRLVLDMDDLLSRRMAAWLESGGTLGLGYVQEFLPAWLRSMLAVDRLSKVLIRREQRALEREEDAICGFVDVVVLISSRERLLLEDRLTRRGMSELPIIVDIGPPWQPKREAAGISTPYRFIFLGSDRLVQNRLTIDHLLALWRRYRPNRPLVIFGDQVHHRRNVPAGVEFAGWADDLKNIYDGHSILLAPSLVRGGIKTKILEALSFDCPVVANATALEGIIDGDYPLDIDRLNLAEFLNNPENSAELIESATKSARELLSRYFGVTRVDAGFINSMMGISNTFSGAERSGRGDVYGAIA